MTAIFSAPLPIESGGDGGDLEPRLPVVPDGTDLEAVWRYLANGIDRVLFEPTYGVDISSLVGLYSVVHEFCTSQGTVWLGRSSSADQHRSGHIMGEDLYKLIETHIKQYHEVVRLQFRSLSPRLVLERYLSEFSYYNNVAHILQHIFRYLDRYWVKRQMDEGKRVYDIFSLLIVLWHRELFQELSQSLIDSICELVDTREQESLQNLPYSKRLVDFILSLQLDRSYSASPVRELYGNILETPLRVTIGKFYDSYELSFLYRRSFMECMNLHGPDALEMENRLAGLIVQGRLSRQADRGIDGTATVKLLTMDLAIIEVGQKAAACSYVLSNLFTYFGSQIISRDIVPIPKVTGEVLNKVLEWCEHHINDQHPSGDESCDQRDRSTTIDDWDREYFQVDQEMLFDIILAANYLDIEPLLSTGCKVVANMIKGKTPQEIRTLFHITNDLTAEEEEQIRRENEWIDDRSGANEYVRDSPLAYDGHQSSEHNDGPNGAQLITQDEGGRDRTHVADAVDG